MQIGVRFALCATGVVAGMVYQPAFGQSEVRRQNYQMVLQATGDWSGNYQPEGIGFHDNTVVLYDYEASCINELGPEYVDMECHIDALTSAIERKIPEGFTGIAILDFESWPLSLYNKNYEEFREIRIQAQLQLHPEFTYKQAEDLAAEIYLPYVQEFYLRSLEIARAMRPEASWGYYSNIYADRWSPQNATRRWVNDQSLWLWDEVDVLCPYGYTGVDESDPRHETIEALVIDKTREAVRIAELVRDRTGKRPLVLTYLNPRIVYWGISGHEGDWLTPEQMHNHILGAWVGGSDGFVLWQSVGDDKYRRPEPELIEYLDSVVLDAVKTLRLGRWALE